MREKLKIKFICTGNTCRSPMAEGIFRKISREILPHAEITSAGLAAAYGIPASENAVLACREAGIDISGHRSSSLSYYDIEETDYFFVMTENHAQALIHAGVEKSKIYLPDAVDDPYGRDIEAYRRARDKIAVECEKFLDLLKDEHMRIEPLTDETIHFAAMMESACFSHPWSEDGIKGRLNDENTDFFIAMAGETPLGYIGMETAADEGYIFNVAVFPQYRRHGIGRALIGRLINLCEEKSLHLLTLEVRAGNSAAIALYGSCGFEKVGERRDYYSDPKENAVLMTRFFTEKKGE